MSLKTSLGQLQQPPIVCCPLFVDTYLVLALFLITISHHIQYFSKLVPISQQVQQGHSLKDLAPCCAGHGTSGYGRGCCVQVGRGKSLLPWQVAMSGHAPNLGTFNDTS